MIVKFNNYFVALILCYEWLWNFVAEDKRVVELGKVKSVGGGEE